MNKYLWDKSSGKCPQIDPHGKTKHEVIQEYILRYLQILGQYPFDRRMYMNLVDGFAGGGIYNDPNGGIHEGSPLIFIKTVQQAEIILSQDKDFRIDPTFYFIEKNPKSYEYLEDYLKKQLAKKVYDRVNLFNDLFENKLNEIIKDIKTRGTAHRTIFLLDQTGYREVNVNTINKIFKELPNAEIMLTINVDWLTDYANNSPRYKKIFENLNLDFDLDFEKERKKQKYFRRWFQFELFKSFRKAINAKYYTNFLIKSRESHKSYWFMHLSMVPKARNEMQCIHWKKKNHFVSETKDSLNIFTGYDPFRDESFTNQPTFTFSDKDRLKTELDLQNEIPRTLTHNLQPVGSYFEQQINETVATQEMIYDEIENLFKKGEVEVLTKNKNKKRKGAKVSDQDLVRIPNQLHFFKD